MGTARLHINYEHLIRALHLPYPATDIKLLIDRGVFNALRERTLDAEQCLEIIFTHPDLDKVRPGQSFPIIIPSWRQEPDGEVRLSDWGVDYALRTTRRSTGVSMTVPAASQGESGTARLRVAYPFLVRALKLPVDTTIQTVQDGLTLLLGTGVQGGERPIEIVLSHPDLKEVEGLAPPLIFPMWEDDQHGPVRLLDWGQDGGPVGRGVSELIAPVGPFVVWTNSEAGE